MSNFMLIISSLFSLWGLISYNLIDYKQTPSLWIYINVINIYWIAETFNFATEVFIPETKKIGNIKSQDLLLFRIGINLFSILLCGWIDLAFPSSVGSITYYYFYLNYIQARLLFYSVVSVYSVIKLMNRWYGCMNITEVIKNLKEINEKLKEVEVNDHCPIQ